MKANAVDSSTGKLTVNKDGKGDIVSVDVPKSAVAGKALNQWYLDPDDKPVLLNSLADDREQFSGMRGPFGMSEIKRESGLDDAALRRIVRAGRGAVTDSANPVRDVVDAAFEGGKKVVVLAGDAADAAAMAGDGVLIGTNHGVLMKPLKAGDRVVMDGVDPAKLVGNKRLQKLLAQGVQVVVVSPMDASAAGAAFAGLC
jgi:hypothetical protein